MVYPMKRSICCGDDIIQMILTKIESNLECIYQKLHKYTDRYTQLSCQLYTQKIH